MNGVEVDRLAEATAGPTAGRNDTRGPTDRASRPPAPDHLRRRMRGQAIAIVAVTLIMLAATLAIPFLIRLVDPSTF